MNKSVIIYLPTGKELKFTNTMEIHNGNADFEMAVSIEKDGNSIIVVTEGTNGREDTEIYCNIPFFFNKWHPKG